MKQLLKANFFRLSKSKMIYVLFAVFAGFTGLNALFLCFGRSPGSSGITARYFLANNISANFFVVIFIMVFIGSDFKNGAVRNKLIVGKTRYQLYLANLILVGTVASAFYFTPVLISCLAGIKVGFGGYGVGFYLLYIFTGYAIALFYASLYTFLNMIAASQSKGILYTLLVYFAAELVFGLIFLLASLYFNIRFFEIIFKLFPYGQVMLLSGVTGYYPVTTGMYFLFIALSLFYAALLALVGSFIFSRKDLK